MQQLELGSSTSNDYVTFRYTFSYTPNVRMEFEMLKMRIIVVSALWLIAFVRAKNDVITGFRLPTNFKPISYALDITTHLEYKFKFEGVVDIRIVCEESSSVIVLHAKTLDIDRKRVTIVDKTGKPVGVNDVSFSPQVDKMYVSADRHFEPEEEFVLTVKFAGDLTNDQAGYYTSSYVEKKTNRTKWLAITKFEPTNARRAFPCFDEPMMKATFKVKLRRKKELKSFSNMRLIKNSIDPSDPNYAVDEFEESVPMSTYLVAYMVSDLHLYVAASNVASPVNVKLRIIARKEAVVQTETGKKMGRLALEFYERYFDEKFPSSKIDMVGLRECAAGVVENWGLVAFSEAALMIDPKMASHDDTCHVAQTIAHGLAHMWFGNMITMKWWTDLWLKEGLASYVASRALDKFYPKWTWFQLKTAEHFIRVLELDSLQSSHPLSVPVENPDEIQHIYDTISYSKSWYLFHMINLFLDEQTFKQGIRNYIHKYKFANAEQDDLWSVLTDEAHRVGSLPKNMTLKEIMDSWTSQTGYPVVKVVRDYDSGSVTVSQERFLTIKSNATGPKSCWWVPLTMTSSKEVDFSRTKKAQTWLNCKNNEYTMTLDKDEAWVIFNVQMAGLYRVMYDKRNWLNIIRTLNDTERYKNIHTLNRAQLIHDALALSQTGHLDYGITFKLLSYLKHEDEYIPWMAAIRGLNPITRIMKRTPNNDEYKVYMQSMLKPLYKKFHNMEVKPNDFEKMRIKDLVVSQACYFGLRDCIEKMKMLSDKWMRRFDPDKNNVPPGEYKSTIYCQAVKYGGEKVWNFFLERYKHANVELEKSRYLWALGCTKEMRLLYRYLTWTIGKHAVIRKQDAVAVFQSSAMNDMGYYVAKEYLYSKIKEMSKFLHPYGDRIGKYLDAIGSEMKMKNELNEFQLFIDKSKRYLNGTETSVKQTIETIKINIEWWTKFYHKIIDFEEVKVVNSNKTSLDIHELVPFLIK